MKKKSIILIVGILVASFVFAQYPGKLVDKSNLPEVNSQFMNKSTAKNAIAATAVYYVLSFIKH